MRKHGSWHCYQFLVAGASHAKLSQNTLVKTVFKNRISWKSDAQKCSPDSKENMHIVKLLTQYFSFQSKVLWASTWFRVKRLVYWWSALFLISWWCNTCVSLCSEPLCISFRRVFNGPHTQYRWVSHNVVTIEASAIGWPPWLIVLWYVWIWRKYH